MEFDYKILSGVVATILVVLGYGTYVRDILRGTNKPHMLGWIIWCVVTGIVFAAQISDRAGPGAWNMGAVAFFVLLISALSFRYGERNFSRLDIGLFMGALAAIPLWVMTKDPTASVILLTCIHYTSLTLTLMKAWRKPHEESETLYSLSTLRHLLAVAAMANYSIATTFYPAMMVLANIIAFGVIMGRRRYLGAPNRQN